MKDVPKDSILAKEKRVSINLLIYIVLIIIITCLIPLWNSFTVSGLFFKFCQAVFPYVVFIAITLLFNMVFENKKWEDLGYTREHLCRQILIGVIVGFSTVLAYVGGALLSGYALLDILGVPSDKLFLNIIKFLFFVGFGEELMFRGYIQGRLSFLFKSRWTALIFASLLFGMWHFIINRNVMQVIITSVLGSIYGVCKMKNGMISPSIAHGLHDIGLFLIGYFLLGY